MARRSRGEGWQKENGSMMGRRKRRGEGGEEKEEERSSGGAEGRRGGVAEEGKRRRGGGNGRGCDGGWGLVAAANEVYKTELHTVPPWIQSRRAQPPHTYCSFIIYCIPGIGAYVYCIYCILYKCICV